MKESWCDWHVLVVTGSADDGDREVVVLHPECGFTYTSGEFGSWQWHCAIQWEMDNAGFDLLLDKPNDVPGWYRARMRSYEIRGFDWSEVDNEYEVEALTVAGQ